MEGWEQTTLGATCEVIAGQSPKGSNYNESGDGLPFYQGKKEFGDKYLGAPTKWTTQITREATAGDVLMSVRAPVGPINFSTERICIGRGLASIRAKKQIHRDFLFYLLLSMQKQIKGNEGAVFASINKMQIENIQFRKPPLSEQKQIVAILDKAFAAIETATANTKKNLANARELFESQLNSVLSPIGGDWVQKYLGDLYEITSSKRVFKSEWKRSGVPFYRAREIVKLARQGFVDNELYITRNMYEQYSAKYGIPEEGDIMVTGVGTLGVCYLVKKGDEFYFKDGNIIWLKNKGHANSRFIEYAFKSDSLRMQIDNSAGATVGTYTITRANNTKIFLPPFSDQDRIVKKLDMLSAKTRSLSDTYNTKLNALAELKQALLHKSFCGEL